MENIRENITIGPRCAERFLPLGDPCCRPLADLGVVLAGISDLRGDYRIDRAGLSFHVIVFTLGGGGTLRSDVTTRRLSRGDLLIAPAGATYFYERAAASWQMVWYHLDAAKSRRTFDRPECLVLRSHLFERLRSATESLLLEVREGEPDAPRAARFYAELIALHLQRELEPDPDPARRDLRARFAELWDTVGATVAQPWSIRDLARHFGASPAHFQRLCVEHCALPPGRMLFRLRMQRAEGLLRNTAHPLKLVGPMVGYENPFAFSTAFKRYAGASPRGYRQSAPDRSAPPA
jgi:AraC-like DNA-binding protein